MYSVNVFIDKISYHNRDDIEITLNINNTELIKSNLNNVNIDISEFSEKRNEHKYGFGAIPIIQNNHIRIIQKLSDSLINGIYFISHIKFIYSRPDLPDYQEISFKPKENFELIFFHINHLINNSLTDKEISSRIHDMLKLREDYRNKTIISSSALDNSNTKEFKVLVFGVGCLLHTIQELNGYTIYPLNKGLDYSNLNNAVNHFLNEKFNFQIPLNPKIDEAFQKSTPLFVIDYHRVKALDEKDALMHCNVLSQTIFSILGLKKGQRPNIFATVVIDKIGLNYLYHFQFPGYGGNLVSEFSPTATANLIDKIFPLLSSNPWLKLIIDNHAFALNEDNIDLKYFRFWAVLELIAKKEIKNDNLNLLLANKQHIVDEKRNDLKTNTAFRKVYYYIYNCNFQKFISSCQVPGLEFSYMFEMNEYEESEASTEKITLWEALNAIYAIRNAAAHQGKFIIEVAQKGNWKDQLAAKYYALPFNLLLSHLETLVNNVIEKQIESLQNNRYRAGK